MITNIHVPHITGISFVTQKKKSSFLKISHREGLWQLFGLILCVMLSNCFDIQSCEVTGSIASCVDTNYGSCPAPHS